MVRLCVPFFTHDMIRAIRGRDRRHNNKNTTDAWRAYREYHNKHLERVNSRNAVFILREFQNVCEIIATFSPKEDVVTHVSVYLKRKYTSYY